MAISKGLPRYGKLALKLAGGEPAQMFYYSQQRGQFTTSGASQRQILPSGAILVELAAEEATFYRFVDVAGNATQDANSHYFPAGVQQVPVDIDVATGEPFTHIAVIQQSTAGLFQWAELH